MGHNVFLWKQKNIANLMPKALIVSTYDSDGVGRFADSLMLSLAGLGYSSNVLCLQSSNDHKDSSVGIFDNDSGGLLLYKIFNKLRSYFYSSEAIYAFNEIGSVTQTVLAHNPVMDLEYDLLVIMYTSGMFRASDLKALSSNNISTPVMIYGVDMNLFTGGCHYANNCRGYMSNCSACPAVKPRARKLVEKNHKEKQKYFSALLNSVVVSSSNEHHQQITDSSIFAKSRVEKILFYVDEKIFGSKEQVRDDLRIRYGLQGRSILVRSSSEKRKGCDIFVEAIRRLVNNYSESMVSINILCIGDDYVYKSLFGVHAVKNYGYTASIEELSDLYTISDVFVNPSLADGGPMMLAEALMSYTPVITTNVGLATDLVIENVNGIVIKDKSALDLQQALLQVLKMDDATIGLYRCRARTNALRLFSKERYQVNLSRVIRSLK
jgi:glycosyltransferase involved in cell wall biosynthesis